MSETNIHKRHHTFRLSVREERLLFDAQPVRKAADDQLTAEQLEAIEKGQDTGEHPDNPVEAIQRETELGILATTPAVVLGTVREPGVLLETIRRGGYLVEQIESVEQQLPESGQETLIKTVLGDPKNALVAIAAVQNEIQGNKDDIKFLEKYKTLITIDQLSFMNVAIENLHNEEEQAEKGAQGGAENLSRRRQQLLQEMGLSEHDISSMAQEIRKFSVSQGQEHTENNEATVIRFFWNLLGRQKRRNLMGPVRDADATSRADIRDRYTEILEQQNKSLRKYLRALLQERIKRLQKALKQEREKLEQTPPVATPGSPMPEVLDTFVRDYAIEGRGLALNDVLSAIQEDDADTDALAAAIDNVEQATQEIEAKDEDTSKLGAHLEQDVIAAKKNEEIAEEIARLADKLSQDGRVTEHPEAIRAVESIQNLFKDYAAGKDSVPVRQRRDVLSTPFDKISRCLQTLLIIEARPGYPATLAALAQEADQAIAHEYPLDDGGQKNLGEGREKLLKESDSAIDAIRKSTKMEMAQVLQINPQLDQRRADIELKVRAAGDPKDPHRREIYQQAVMETKELKKAEEMLGKIVVRDIPTTGEFQTLTELEPGIANDTLGYYSFKTGEIYLNIALIGSKGVSRDSVEAHERNHALIDVLSRKTLVFPGLLVGTQIELDRAAKEQGKSAEQFLREFAISCHIDTNKPNWKDLAMDEAAVALGDFVGGRKTDLSDAQRNILTALNAHRETEDQLGPAATMRNLKNLPFSKTGTGEGQRMASDEPREGGQRMGADELREGGMRADADDLNGATEGGGDAAAPGEGDNNEYPFQKTLKEINWRLDRIDEFMKVYPQNLHAPAGNGQTYEAYINFLKQQRDHGADIFNQDNIQNEAQRKILQEGFVKLNTATDTVFEATREFDSAKMDLTHVPTSTKQSLFQRMSQRIVWCSLTDMWGMIKDAGEDITRMWKRRGEDARAKLGRAITSTFVPDAVPYLGRLKYDFRGREKHSEHEEVEVWEKRFEHVDNHTLQHMLTGQTDKDKVRGIVNILTKRGRMDFNDDEFWSTLERLSKYSMPHGPCKRDNQLRNAYLQKLMAQIWDDKDIFEDWKNGNDGAIQKGRDVFKATCDDFSNVKNGLAGRLHDLLEAWDKQKDHGGKVSPEEEINPHLYEALIHYSMKNGKMTMEQKFFYLIQGVAHGILNIDRLRGFGGDQGGILNSFPFIDYFYYKNNTHYEIQQIAQRLGGDKQYTPNYRTTYFLYEEVMKNPKVRERVAKALKTGQNIDHEDIPMYVSMLDYGNVKQLVSIYSGNLWKLSAPAMKNAYVGYNSAFQYYTARAKMLQEEGGVEGVKPFTTEDIQHLTTILVGFIAYDNMITKAASDGTNRPNLSWNEINNEPPVSGDKKTHDYRDKATAFASEIVKNRLGIDTMTMNDADGNPLNITADEFIGDGRNADKVETLGKNKRKKLLDEGFHEQLTKEIYTRLQSTLQSDPKSLLRWLAEFAEGGKSFLPEEEKFTYQNIKSIAPDWK